MLTNVNVHGVGPMLSVTVGGTAEVRARVTDLGVGDLGRSKVKSHYLWWKAPCQDLPKTFMVMEQEVFFLLFAVHSTLTKNQERDKNQSSTSWRGLWFSSPGSCFERD